MPKSDHIYVNPTISIPVSDVELTAIRASGPGGQNVNKVASAVHLRFNIWASGLTYEQKTRVMSCRDSRITEAGEIIIKAQTARTQSRNQADALSRLGDLLGAALKPRKKRKLTKPTYGSVKRRLKAKKTRANIKLNRKPVRDHE